MIESSARRRIRPQPSERWGGRLAAPTLPPMLATGLAPPGEDLPPRSTETRAAAKAAGPTPEQRLIQRATMGWTTGAQAEINALGYNAWLEQQLDFGSLDDSPLEDALNDGFKTLSMTVTELFREYGEDQFTPAYELIFATFFRSVYSPRQLLERLVVFWTDHFNIPLFGDEQLILKPIDDRDVIRANAMRTFPALLSASAHSPAMMLYLSNATNEKGHPNENYARELMELHTLGADRGYTQEDVREVARAFTGWTVDYREANRGQFVFNPFTHDEGAKTVLGHTIPAGGGQEDGERVLQILAEHPLTADFVSRKMLRYFWGYEPPESFVKQVAQKYLDTGGNIRAMTRTILRKAWVAAAPDKLKRPYHHMVSAVRALGAEVDDAGLLIDAVHNAGHLPFNWDPPNGYPDSDAYWSSFVLPRWNLPDALFGGGINLDIPALDPERNTALTREAVRGRLNRQLTGSTMTGATKTALRSYLEAMPLNREAVRDAISLSIASPDFQQY